MGQLPRSVLKCFTVASCLVVASGAGVAFGEGAIGEGDPPGPSGSPAAVTYGGNITVSASSGMHFEIAGAAPGTGHDQVTVTGNLVLNGTLQLQILDGYEPDYLTEFDILIAGSRTGLFKSIVGELVHDDLLLVPVYDRNGLGLTLVAAIPGDANLDGVVNGQDLLAWQSGLFTEDEWVEGDFNLDGLVNGLDILVWQSHLFESVESLGGAAVGTGASVPEPGVAVLVGLGVLALLPGRRGVV